MARYSVCFTNYHSYEVEANSESEAEDKAYQQYKAEMSRPIAHTGYDEVEVQNLDEDED